MAYSLLASIILFVVSLFSGLFRFDFVSALGPRGLLSIVFAIFLAIGLRFLGLNVFHSDALAMALVRLPLYLIALAFGPSAGLVAGILFLSLANLLNFPDLILLIELVVLGWFAISPSPRQFWWAGSLGAIFSYCLTWAAAGSAYLELEFQNGSSLEAHLALHQGSFASLAGIAIALAFITPRIYKRLFPFSNIAPETADEYPVTEPKAELEVNIPELYLSKPKSRNLKQLDSLQLFELERNKEKTKLSHTLSLRPFEKPRRDKKSLGHVELSHLSRPKH